MLREGNPEKLDTLDTFGYFVVNKGLMSDMVTFFVDTFGYFVVNKGLMKRYPRYPIFCATFSKRIENDGSCKNSVTLDTSLSIKDLQYK